MIVYGRNVAKELLNNNTKINKVILSKNFSDKNLLEKLKKYNVTYLDRIIMDKKYNGNHQGVVLEIDDYKYEKIDSTKDDKFVVILDHLEDPHNFGAIIRTCEALGVDAIIIPKDRNVSVNSTVVKTSAGAIYNMPIVKVTNLATTIGKLKDIGYWIVGTDMAGEDYTKIDYNAPICLIIGNEGHGMSKIVTDNCDYIAKIPMVGKINSLNASVSCGILLSKIVSGDR